MTVVLHLVDSGAPPAAADAMGLLRHRRPADVLAAVGPGTAAALAHPDVVIRRPWPWAITAAPAIRELATQRGAAVIHCWSLELAAAATAIDLPTCVTLFSPPAPAQAEALRTAAAEGAMFIVTSPAARQALLSAGANGSAVAVIPPAVEPAAPQHPPPGPRLVLIAPPQHDDDRGPFWAAWALALLHEIEDAVELIIPGDGPAVARAEDFARPNDLLGRLRLERGPDAADAWSAADAAVLYDRDGIGLAGLARAVAAGLPVIAADAGELAGQLVHERTALLAQPAQPRLLARAIWRLVRQRDLGSRLAEQARRELSSLTDVAGWLDRMEALYRQLAAA